MDPLTYRSLSLLFDLHAIVTAFRSVTYVTYHELVALTKNYTNEIESKSLFEFIDYHVYKIGSTDSDLGYC